METEDPVEKYLDFEQLQKDVCSLTENADRSRKELMGRPICAFAIHSIIHDLYSSDDRMIIDDEDITYFSDKFSFSLKEFHDLHSYLEQMYSDHSESNSESCFPEYRMYFEYEGKKFIWRMLHGQGTACQFLRGNANYDDWSSSWPMKFEENKKVIL